MKKMIRSRLCIILLTTALLTLTLNYFLQIKEAQKDMIRSSTRKINQIEHILDRISTAEAELPHILSMILVDDGTTLFVISKANGTILGSTNPTLNGISAMEAGLILPQPLSFGTGFFSSVLGVPSYCLFKDCGSVLIGISQAKTFLYQNLLRSMLLSSLYLLFSAFVIIFVLNQCINQILQGQLNSSAKLSRIFDMADAAIGVYEYTSDQKQVLGTKKVGTLLMLSSQEAARLLSDKQLFEERIREICSHPVAQYKNVYRLPAATEYYIRIQSFSNDTGTLGVITDVTEEILEKQQLEHDRDYDVLTELLSRRGFYNKMDRLFREPDRLSESVMMMLDLDHLKYINDNFGHASGDKAIQAAANILAQCPASNKVLARLSGDEFVLFLYGYRRSELEAYIREIHERMMHTSICFFDEAQVPIRMSGGYVFYSEHPVSCSNLLRLSDQAMYQAKKRRKSEFLCYQE